MKPMMEETPEKLSLSRDKYPELAQAQVGDPVKCEVSGKVTGEGQNGELEISIESVKPMGMNPAVDTMRKLQNTNVQKQSYPDGMEA